MRQIGGVNRLISIVGPTGVGKSAVAIRMAQRLGCPVISADSVQVYRGLDIGSGKVTAAEQGGVPHHMMDILPPDEAFNAGEFARRVDALLPELFRIHRDVVMVGGTGLYFQAVWEGFDEMPEVEEGVRAELNAALERGEFAALQAELAETDPETWERMDQRNPARVIRALEVWRSTGMPISAFRQGSRRQNPWEDIRIGLELPREELYTRIEQRVDEMLAAGLLEETRRIGEGYGLDCKGLQSVGYREMVGYLRHEYGWEEAVRLMKRNTRRYAKRQFTWFRHREGIDWFAVGDLDGIMARVGA